MTIETDSKTLTNSSLPLFMHGHTVADNRDTIPREGVDFVYDGVTQKASWLNEAAINKWSPTAYADTRVDGVDYIALNLEPND